MCAHMPMSESAVSTHEVLAPVRVLILTDSELKNQSGFLFFSNQFVFKKFLNGF